MLRVFVVFLVFFLQYTWAKNSQPQLHATAKISRLLDDITEFFEDIISAVSSLFSFGNKKGKNTWSMKTVWKYAKNTFKSGYKIIKDALPVISIARESLERVAPHMPNVSLGTFVEHVFKTITPELAGPKNSKEF